MQRRSALPLEERRARVRPAGADAANESDAVLDDLWSTYYRTTFNPARMRLDAMVKEMPRDYWPNMPETSLIPAMVAEAEARVADMSNRGPDQTPLFAGKIAARVRPAMDVPDIPLDELRAEVSACRRCPLHRPATQSVFGEGPRDAGVMFVGEQPGDQEIRGPAVRRPGRPTVRSRDRRGRSRSRRALRHQCGEALRV